MAINVDKKLTPFDIEVEDGPELELDLTGDDVEYEVVGEEMQEDGGVVVDFAPGEGEDENVDHDRNLAEVMDDQDLVTLATELVQAYKDDRETRKPWEAAYIKGISLLGLQIEDRQQPWAGAAGVFHPLLTEAVIKFQADAMHETFPAAGPVLTKVAGKVSREKEAQAKRVRVDMNYQCTEVMTEYRDEHEQALFHLGIAGSIFKKVYYSPTLGRYTSQFVMADDFVVAYGTTDLKTCPRATHVMKMSKNDIIKAQYAGQYVMLDVPDPVVEYTDVERKEDKAAGSAPSAEKDDRNTVLEMHVDLDLAGFEDKDESDEETGIMRPYIVTIEQHSQQVLGIYRNWLEEDPHKLKNEFFAPYKFLPGLGFYGIGLVHLLGGLAKGATSILRQLIDAGTLANLPAGLKSRGLRIKGDNSPLRPGEMRDVDVPGGAIKDNITFVPFKEPSSVLLELMGFLVSEGKSLASIADMKISDMNSQAPVGTTLALLERGMKVMTGVQSRIHAAMKREFKMLAELVRVHAPDEYEYDVEEGVTRGKDYDGRVDVIPVSNPNASTMAHRIMRHQAIHQLAQTAPHLYDQKALHRGMIEALGEESPEKLIPLDDEMRPMDPVAENMAIMTGKPVKAHIHQDHKSHIRVHVAAGEDPKIIESIGKTPAAKAIMAAAAAHIQEHVAFAYRRAIEKELGVPLPEFDKDLPAETEVHLSKLVADAADKLLKKDLAEAQAQKNAESQKDPVLQLQKMDAETKAKEVERKGMADKLRAMLGREQIASKEKVEGSKLGVNVQQDMLDKQIELKRLEVELARIQSAEKQAGARLGVDVALGVADDEIERERIESQEAQSTIREAVNLQRNENADAREGERLTNERMRDTQNMAQRLLGVIRGENRGSQEKGEDK